MFIIAKNTHDKQKAFANIPTVAGVQYAYFVIKPNTFNKQNM
jgi:hypothetical protein